MKPTVKDGFLWLGEPGAADAAPMPLASPGWLQWLDGHQQFQFTCGAGRFSARREDRHGSAYWYAYRRRDGVLHKAYLGRPADLSMARLTDVAAGLAGQPMLTQLSLTADAPSQSAAESWSANTAFVTQAKFRPPTLPPSLITRPRLTDNINTPVTFISAPGGFGKSTMLNDWRREHAGMPVAWAALDGEDDHLLRFWTTVIMALQTARPGLGQKLMPFLQRTSTITPADIVARLTDELACEDGEFCIGLVLDDFHHIRQADVHTSVQLLLEHLPPSLQLIISGRTRPPLALGRLRAMGLVTELEVDDLRFTLPEGIAFLQQSVSGEPLAYGDMEALVRRTGGWVVGLKLAVLALNKQPDRRHVIDTFSGAHLFLREYFMETALSQHSQAMQTFLLQTSILKQLTGGLCDAVTGGQDGADVLERLWQENLFIGRGEDQRWYRYHDLFAEMLCSQLNRQFPGQIADLHRRAAAWYVAQNMSADAVHHLLSIEDWETAAQVIEDIGLRELAESGEDSRLLRWVQSLPETVIQRHKKLLFVYLRLANLALPPDEVIRFLQRIEHNLTSKARVPLTASERDVLEEVRQIKPHLMKGGAFSLSDSRVADPRWQLLTALLITEKLNRPKTEEVGAQMRDIYDRARAEGNLFAAIIAGTDLSNRALVRGNLRQSEKLAYQVLQQALLQVGRLPEPTSIALALLSQVCLARNELAQGHLLLDRALTVDPNPTSSNMPINIAVTRARLQSAEGKHAEARATIQAARALQALRPSRSYDDRDLAAYEARFCARQGLGRTAEQLLKEAEADKAHALSEIVTAEILLAQARPAAAETLLTQFLAQYPAGYPNEPSLDARLLLVAALAAQYKMNQALRLLTEAVQQAAPEWFIRPFLDHGQPLIPLLALLLHNQSLTAEADRFVGEVLLALGYAGDAPTTLPAASLDSLAKAASITTREQDVLRLLAEGLSNQAIADALCISTGTVKTHLTNIYAKLAVSSRVQAVTEARALKVLWWG